jgi:hypothetical protein
MTDEERKAIGESFIGAKVFKKERGIGTVIRKVDSESSAGYVWLLIIQFENRRKTIALYNDEVKIICNA